MNNIAIQFYQGSRVFCDKYILHNILRNISPSEDLVNSKFSMCLVIKNFNFYLENFENFVEL